MKNTLVGVSRVLHGLASRDSALAVCRQLRNMADSKMPLRPIFDGVRKKSIPNYLWLHIHLPDGIVLFRHTFAV